MKEPLNVAESDLMYFQKFFKKTRWLVPPLRMIFLYNTFIIATRLITLSIVTYFTVTPTSLLQDIHETLSHYELIFMSLSSLLFVVLLHALNPFASRPYLEILNSKWIEKKFIPGWIDGTLVAGIVVTSLLCLGSAKYVGYLIKVNEEPFELIYILAQVLALVLFTYCEEWIFHHHLAQTLSQKLPQIVTAHVIAFFYTGVKWLQFDLSLMQLISFYLISWVLFYRTQENTFVYGAGFLAGLFIFFHPLSSLPILGHEMIGVFFIQQEPASSLSFLSKSSKISPLKMLPFFQIESQGPLSGLLLQALLILDITTSMLKKRSTLMFFR